MNRYQVEVHWDGCCRCEIVRAFGFSEAVTVAIQRVGARDNRPYPLASDVVERVTVWKLS